MSEILTGEASEFLEALHAEFAGRRAELLAARAERGAPSGFLPDTEAVRGGDWRVEPVPPALQDRRVEITGPTDRKMVINALNSGARGFMADFEDANSPTWENMTEGQANLRDAIRGTIEHREGDRSYSLGEQTATLLVRPRGLHLPERHLEFAGAEAAGCLVDFGLFFFHNAALLAERGDGPFFYLPKLEHWREAELWDDVFCFAQDHLGIPRGTVKATVLIETVPAAFQMEEILHALRRHSAGLNAGRWDYIFSMIKCFSDRPDFVLPDRASVTMTVPFMRAYTELLVRTCHRRGAHAMGGMAALIPSRRDPEVNERALEAVRADKSREAGDGFDGTWVAHPDLVPVAMDCFDEVLGDRPNQVERLREDVQVDAAGLLDVASTPGEVTEEGLRSNVSVGIRYLSSWLGGVGAAAIDNLMEDTATAEIARSQVWQWARHGVTTSEGAVTAERVRALIAAEPDASPEARELFERVALSERLEPFLTLEGYSLLP